MKNSVTYPKTLFQVLRPQHKTPKASLLCLGLPSLSWPFSSVLEFSTLGLGSRWGFGVQGWFRDGGLGFRVGLGLV